MAAEVACGDAGLLRESRSYLRCVLREYRDESARYLANLRRELATTAGTLHDITGSLEQSDVESDARLAAGMERLKALAGTAPASPFADVVRAATAELGRSIADIRKQQKLILSQLHTEIRLLHKRTDALTEAALDDPGELIPRDEMERRTPWQTRNIPPTSAESRRVEPRKNSAAPASVWRSPGRVRPAHAQQPARRHCGGLLERRRFCRTPRHRNRPCTGTGGQAAKAALRPLRMPFRGHYRSHQIALQRGGFGRLRRQNR